MVKAMNLYAFFFGRAPLTEGNKESELHQLDNITEE
jgi:hypothetical protein